MAIAKRELEDAETKRYIEEMKKQKKLQEKEKKEMLEQLARDKEERFGKKFNLGGTNVKTEKVYTPYENAEYYLKSIKLMYPSIRHGDDCKTCYSTLKVILSNICKNSTEEKFRKVKATNPNFIERVGKIPLAIKTLISIGFIEEGEFYICNEPDIETFKKIVLFLESEIETL